MHSLQASPPPKGLSLTVKAGTAGAHQDPVSAYASTPRSTATPRHHHHDAFSGGAARAPESPV